VKLIENKRQNIISLYHLGFCQQKWLKMGFVPMPIPTRGYRYTWSKNDDISSVRVRV